MPYQSPNISDLSQQWHTLLHELKSAMSFSQLLYVISKVDNIRASFQTMNALALINYDLNVSNNYYKFEVKRFNTYTPYFKQFENQFFQWLSESDYYNKLEAHFGKQWGFVAKFKASLHSDEVVLLQKQEEQVLQKYQALQNTAMHYIDGRQVKLSDYWESPNRKERKKAHDAYWQFVDNRQSQIDFYVSNLVSIRHKIAQTLGYENYTTLAYKNLKRFDITFDNMHFFKTQIRLHIVPLMQKINFEKADNLNLLGLSYYDTSIHFFDGNAKPIGDEDSLVATVDTLSARMHTKMTDFWELLQEKGLYDFKSRKTKMVARGATFGLPMYGYPFIKASLTGNAYDVNVLTHELGHAFQYYLSEEKGQACYEYRMPGTDVAEVEAKAMEFLTWQWHDLFFAENTAKFQKAKLIETLQMLLRCAVNDDFQCFLYSNPTATAEERDTAYLQICESYFGDVNRNENDFLKRGGHWRTQWNIADMPFYGMSYALAGFVALQLWWQSKKDWEGTWSKYMDLCSQGGSVGFTDLIKILEVNSPFELGAVPLFCQNLMKQTLYDKITVEATNS